MNSYYKDGIDYSPEAPQAASSDVRSIGSMVDALVDDVEEILDQHEDEARINVKKAISDALSRAEEQGYRVGYDAALQENANQLRIISQLRESEAQSIKAMQRAEETIRRQRETINLQDQLVANFRQQVALYKKSTPLNWFFRD